MPYYLNAGRLHLTNMAITERTNPSNITVKSISQPTLFLLTMGLAMLLSLIYRMYIPYVSLCISAHENHSCMNGIEQVDSHPIIIYKHDPLPILKQVIIFRFWASWSFNRKVQTAILLSLRTQSNARVIIWMLPSTLSSILAQMQRLQQLSCPSNSTLEVRSITELQDLLGNSKDAILRICTQSFRDKSNNMVVLLDMIHFMALYFYGGIYADADMIFMREMRDLHGLAFTYKWDRNVLYYNTAIPGLPLKSLSCFKLSTTLKAVTRIHFILLEYMRRLGSGPRYQILSHVFARCARNNTRPCENSTRNYTRNAFDSRKCLTRATCKNV